IRLNRHRAPDFRLSMIFSENRSALFQIMLCSEDAHMQFVEANGAQIPAIGLGTWELRGRTCARIVEQALRLGYRHLDTAQVYENEREVGEGMRASGVKREDIFLTTKIWTNHF